MTSLHSFGSETQQADVPLPWDRESKAQPQHTLALRKATARSRRYQEQQEDIRAEVVRPGLKLSHAGKCPELWSPRPALQDQPALSMQTCHLALIFLSK